MAIKEDLETIYNTADSIYYSDYDDTGASSSQNQAMKLKLTQLNEWQRQTSGYDGTGIIINSTNGEYDIATGNKNNVLLHSKKDIPLNKLLQIVDDKISSINFKGNE